MPVNKSALLRYRVIDGCLTNLQRKYPTMAFIIQKIEEQLGVSISESTFSKDLQQMKQTYNAPIKYNKSHNGYCYTEEGFSIREFPLTHDEIEALDYSTALLHQLSGTKMFQQFENAINKVIEGYRVSKIIGKSESQILQVEEPVRSEGNKWLEGILKAIVEKNVIKVFYQGFGKEEKLHLLSPYLLKEYRNRWYVVGFSDRVEKILVLALDRINYLEESNGKYISNLEFSPAKFFKYSVGITQVHNEEPETVVLSFTAVQAPYIIIQPLDHSQKVLVQNEKEVHVQLDVYITVELKMMILSYGPEVKVIKPVRLKEDIKSAISNMLSLYAV